MIYQVQRTSFPPPLSPAAGESGWTSADLLEVAHFHPQSSSHRPRTQARVLYDDAGLYLAFDVRDRYVRCLQTQYQSMVSNDSCVEFFVQPSLDGGYFNFEINSGGAMLLYYIEDPGHGEEMLLRKYTPVPEQVARAVQIASSLPPTTVETPDALDWSLRCFIPYTVFEPYLGNVRPGPGSAWRGNFFKCADGSSHPHWACWSPIGDVLLFHQPRFFGNLVFQG
jgi:hypothetical protein